MLVDSDETFCRSTARLLEQAGYRCDCAQDSHEASRLLTSRHDALITEIHMPGDMPFEFLWDVRTRFPALPIVIVTGSPSVQTAVESLRLSCMDYLVKPVNWTDLLRVVGEAVKKTSYLRVTTGVREEAGRLVTSLEHLLHSMPRLGGGTHEQELAWSLDTFLSQSFSQMAVLSSSIRSVMTSQFQGGAEAPTDVCRTVQCPRLNAYREALESTVEVLAMTKHSFRSKELGLLRTKIKRLLREDS